MRLLVILALACAVSAAQTTPLNALIAEAEAHNPTVATAAAAARAAGDAVSPAGTLPDPQVSVQQMTVGSPAPFAGFTTSNFAYIGVGASQTLPYPGKLKLRAAVAAGQARTAQARVAEARSEISGQVAAAYIQLQYLARQRQVLAGQQAILRAIEAQAESRYAAGTGGQDAVFAAQLEQTKLLGELSTLSANEATAQAGLRALLDRSPQAPGVTPEPLRLTAPPATLSLANAPAAAVTAAQVQSAGQGVALARMNFAPDFQLQYMYQRTGPGFPDYYQWTVGINVPLHRKSRLEPELEGAAQLHLEAQDAQRAQQRQDQAVLAGLQARLANDARLLQLDQGALLPQVRATAAARLAAYGANAASGGTLADVLDSERDALAIEQQYWQTLADHELALAQLGQLTGAGYE
ncbi:MAG TPA: TolC family protein [Terriglobales bacterium]|jgi:outer membrane protein TolC